MEVLTKFGIPLLIFGGGGFTSIKSRFMLGLVIVSMALALSAHTPWVQLVSHVSACWLTGLGFRHT